ncbi:ER membrane protein complex subunit 4 [Trichoplax sp. H2]|uniref:ER membrane protein complex subunit 4 n=1 Tax=Trichoplax adhaerens TaxID=10228 RepID=B3RM27_TRIAD|nr:expressed hypothetical protein [Trichoplax adhaerens]EDV29626.1 expressed hypothetical protein [Trichoplax adhaerens]RDD46680.1 ER membrane protein complex subunit 4 [Trichoplax sp. H2]|eukprot:XP_002108828.1 expressed hypothetical protein [Trichoplax adhaerens]
MASTAASRSGKRHKWSLDFSNRNDPSWRPPDVASPIGYLDKTITDPDSRVSDAALVAKKAWDVATSPLKQLPMNLFIMWMSGDSISIFPVMMVGMMLFRPIKAILSINSITENFEGSQVVAQMMVYVLSNILSLALALYKCSSMGLLPTTDSDWLAFMQPPKHLEFSGGGYILS